MNSCPHASVIFARAAHVRRLSTLFLFILASALHSSAAPATKTSAGSWPNDAVCAVSLSYDDAVPVHHQRVAPLLEQHGLRGTFYLLVRAIDNSEAWKRVAARGHELGNHSLFHPCRRDAANARWLADYYDLADYTPGRFRDELAVANLVLDLLDGGRPRTYGNNCTHLTIGRGEQEQPMDPILAPMFVAARGTITNQAVDPARPVFTRLGHFNGDNKTFAQLRAEIESARASGGWIIYMFHGVGAGTHNLFIADEEHRQLIEWLDRERGSIWTAPVVDVARHLQASSGPESATP
jgi:peptidoglycan/xylan/chitin deacetylase (PgdA/CDA1 family)